MMRSSNDCLLLLAVFIFSNTVQSSHARDTLFPGQAMADGQTLTSANGNFEFGFFRPGHSMDRYVGIWYNTNLIPERTVIWVANRDFPVNGSSGVLKITWTLQIMDQNGDTYYLTGLNWSRKFLSAQLLDNGNLVFRNGNSVLWQSFDKPTDTIVPGMKMEQGRFLTSWASPDNPNEGSFSGGLDPHGGAEFILSKRGETYWKSGVWGGQGFALVPEMGSTALYSYSYVADGNHRFFSYNVADKSSITRIVIDFSGTIQQLVWSEDSKKWDVSWSWPQKPCEVNGTCGAFGICNGHKSPICNCLKVFVPTSAVDWDMGIWSGGCKRRTHLTCGRDSTVNGRSDLFWSVSCTKLPPDPKFFPAQNATECKRSCLNDCSCTAYSNARGCSIWGAHLLNLQQSSPSDRRAEILYLRLAASELKRGKKWLWVLSALGVVMTIFFLGIVLCFIQKGKIKQKAGRNENNEDVVDSDQPAPEISSEETKLNYKEKKDAALPLYSFASIAAATDNFSHANKLGQGGFGPVYKGKLNKGQVVAVKRLSRSSKQGLEEFKNEVILIAKLQHINLVRLLGCCIEGEEKILLYEFMTNKSLDSFIFDPRKQRLLDWRKRHKIIEGIAQGLLYLHNYSRLKIIHRDIKASNVLLDRKLVPKIADFGMARIFGRNESQANTKRVVGTYGYMPPEYAMGGIYSEKSDVFSFGVLLLEIVSGKRNTGFYDYERCLTLLGHAWELWKHCRVLEMVDPKLGSLLPRSEVVRCVHVGLLCVQKSAMDRPTMTDIVVMLSNEAADLPTPKEPAFAFRPTEPDMSEVKICSNNEVTLSVMEPR